MKSKSSRKFEEVKRQPEEEDDLSKLLNENGTERDSDEYHTKDSRKK